ncbi:MAG: molybdopterin-synthase adenylyltransferase MoeB [Gammaproteobacteria bacterium]|nr:MAG: molybdopterin-synthase adenylyltransferase MoeB [Gammaproteobacteria bacterium]
MELTPDQLERYNRHIILDNVGIEGQKRLLSSKVLVIGCGGLGSPVLMYLAAAGVGTIGVVDGDVVDYSNLQRQIIHTTANIGAPKVLSAKQTITALNPDTKVIPIEDIVTIENIAYIIDDYDFVIEATDNFSAKFLINDACVLASKPYSHGGILRFEGQTTTVTPGNACYRCIFEEPPAADAVPACDEVGVLGAIPGVIGTLQATECLKYLLGEGELLQNRLMVYDALKVRFRDIKVLKNPDCPLCGENPIIKSMANYKQYFCELK